MSAGPVKILLVEDTLSDAELLTIALQRTAPDRFKVTHARSWAEAAEQLRREPFDVLLLDLSLPDSSGPETFLRAKEQTRTLPIIVLTGNEDEGLALEAARHGIEDYLVKGAANGPQIARAIRYAIERARAQETLSSYRELLRTIVEGTSDVIYAKDLEGRYLLANAAAAKLVGKSPADMLGKGDANLFSLEEAKGIQDWDNFILQQGKTLTLEETITSSNGGRRMFLTTKGPLLDGAGRKTGVFAISHDVTRMKQAQRHLSGMAALSNLFASGSSRKPYLKAAVKLLQDWCDCESVGVRLLEENGRLPYAAQIGFSRRFLRQERKLCLKTGDCACVRILTRRPRHGGSECSSIGGSLCCNDTGRCVTQLAADPKQVKEVACVEAGYQSLAHAPLRSRKQLLGSLHFADHRPGRFPPETIAFIEDASLLIAEAIERLQVEESLVHSEAQFRSMFERHASVMLLIDPHTGAIVDANPAAAAFYGHSRQKLRCLKLDDLQQLPSDRAGPLTRPAAGGQGHLEVLIHRLSNGQTRLVESYSSPVEVRGRPLLFSIVHDVTERMLLQKQVLEIAEQERQRVGQDLHDSLGGKLTGAALIGKALAHKLAAKSKPDAALAEEVVECINESIRQARAIAHGLCPVELSGGGLAGALAEFAAETGRRSGIRCEFHAAKDFQIEQPFVALHLFRLALEAVSNALRHAAPRRITISLSREPDHLLLEVADDGQGMPARVPEAGLGLRTMKYRAESIGGRLTIRPAERRGTVVSCLVPRSLKDTTTPQVSL